MKSTTFQSPLGDLLVVASDMGLCAVLWPGECVGERVRLAEGGDGGGDGGGDLVLDAAVAQLHEYFAGTRRCFDLPLALQGSAFQVKVWESLAGIPYGDTVSYGEQAERLGRDRGAARAVGAANGKNPVSIVLPCHRVIAGSGALTGFAGGLEAKRWLLDFERSNR